MGLTRINIEIKIEFVQCRNSFGLAHILFKLKRETVTHNTHTHTPKPGRTCGASQDEAPMACDRHAINIAICATATQVRGYYTTYIINACIQSRHESFRDIAYTNAITYNTQIRHKSVAIQRYF